MIRFSRHALGSLALALGRIAVTMAVALCGSVSRAGEAYFIALNNSASAATTVEITPPTGGLYSAAARTDTGSVWNQLANVVPTLNPAGNIGNPATNSATGVYQLYAAPKALVNSLGGASEATINVAVNYAGNTANGFSTVAQTGTVPSALFGNVWRLTSGSNSLTYTIANLPAADTAYDLYFYAAGASTSQQRGVTITLAAGNVPAGGAGSATTSGISSSASSDITLFDSGGGLINQGATWNVVRARSDSARKIVFTQAKHSSGQNWCSGFQIVPVSAPPIISTQPPAATSALVGGTVSISVGAVGEAPLSYQWRKDGVALADGASASGSVIGGATAATLTLSNAEAADAGSYDVVVANSQGSVVSTACALSVQAGLVLDPLPAPVIAPPGGSASFSVGVAGPGPIACRWYFNGAALADGTLPDGTTVSGSGTSTLVLGNLGADRGGDYTFTASNATTSATTPVASLTLAAFAGPVIPSATFAASAYGAIGDGVTDNAAAIQAAINAANAAGGGTVLVPSGTLLCGPLALKSRVHLRFADGSTVKMLAYGQWPNYPYATSATKAFISAENVSDVMVSGQVLIDGQGQAWWDHYEGTNGVTAVATYRPGSVVTFAGVTRGAIIGLSTLNPPNQHFGISNVTSNLVISRCTLTAPDDSPNTDGINMVGRNILIERCDISTGDDNIVIKSGSSNGISSDIHITRCRIGRGHGCSMGSYTNSPGIHNVTVDNLVFEGTGAGINLKANPTRGNVVENIRYDNITMRDVAAPIGIQSYYGTVGYPGSTGTYGAYPVGSWANTAEKFNLTPPTPLNSPDLLPQWRDITISNLTITGSTDHSVIWGVPNMPVRGVTLRNIRQTGGPGFRIYNAENIVFDGDNSFLSEGRPLVIPYNAIVITRSPLSRTVHPGGAVTFSVQVTGTSGVGGLVPVYSWKHDGVALADGVRPDGSVVSGSSTPALTISNVSAAGAGDYTAVVSNALDTYVYSNPADTSTGALVPAGRAATAEATATLSLYAQTYSRQPADALAALGGAARFSVEAPAASAFRWQVSTDEGKTFADVPGAVAATLTLTGVSQDALYRAVAVTEQGDVPSDGARLIAVAPVHFTSTPQVNFAYRTPSRSGISVSGAAAVGTASSVWNNLIGAAPSSTLKTQTLLSSVPLISDSGAASGLNLTFSASSASNAMSTVVKAWNDGSAYGPVAPVFNYYTYYWYSSVLTLRMAGLKPGGMYRLYGYGAGNAAGQGSAWTLADANGGASSPVPADFDKGYTRTASAANAGHSYAILVGQAASDGALTCYVNPNYGGNDPYFNGLQLVEVPSGVIAGQPESRTVYAGASGSFTVDAPSGRAFLWQFSSNGGSTYASLDVAANPSAATATLQLPGVQSSSAGLYRVVVADANRVVAVSAAATLTVSPSSAPVFQTQPGDQVATSGQTVFFSASATGTPSPAYQWYKDGAPIAGGTSATLQLSSVSLADVGSYAVVARNVAGLVTSSVARLSVRSPYSDWVADHGLTLATTGDVAADPDGDGLANLIEFAFGLDPLSGRSGAIEVVDGALANHGPPSLRVGASVTACFVRRKTYLADGLSYSPAFSADLTTWVGADAGALLVIAEDARHQLMELPVPASLATSSRVFFRLRVGLTP